jgi:hypothetical protein
VPHRTIRRRDPKFWEKTFGSRRFLQKVQSCDKLNRLPHRRVNPGIPDETRPQELGHPDVIKEKSAAHWYSMRQRGYRPEEIEAAQALALHMMIAAFACSLSGGGPGRVPGTH